MENRWDAAAAEAFVAAHPGVDRALALRAYASRLLGAEPALVLHGGGNTSLKGEARDLFGEPLPVLFVKASGHDLASIGPEGHVAVALEPLRRLVELESLPDRAMLGELRRHLVDPERPTPSIEAPVHAVIPARSVDHTHADAVLALTNQPDGESHVRKALGDDVLVLPYRSAGLRLAKQVADALAAQPQARAMVWMRHGIVTWGDDPQASYAAMIELVSRAEAYLDAHAGAAPAAVRRTELAEAEARLARVAPLVRGLLATPSGDPDRPWRRVVLRPLVDRATLDFVDAEGARERAVSPPLTADHLIRTRPLPAWVDAPAWDDEARLREQLGETLCAWAGAYDAYVERHRARLPQGVEPFESRPRVLFLPGLGALCAGPDARAVRIAHDITAQTVAAKQRIAAMGSRYEGLDEAQLFDMEYREQQQAKLVRGGDGLAGRVALVTGAAGAIGSGICDALLGEGAHVAVTDLPGEPLERLAAELGARHPDRVLGVPLDVTEADSVAQAFDAVSRAWGGLDVVVINAGLAHVAGLDELDVERFRQLERVNVDGTLLLLAAAGRHLKLQRTGGDVVLVSTKNVFAPGARFGAYSATKAAAHQLARIASLELAEDDVRVNMVAPDAVFSHGERRSGLWAEVGPDRMKARGLDAAGLEDYYRSRNLLKARITAQHVANAVLFFVSRATPTTGATLPVDGGLPDATPR